MATLYLRKTQSVGTQALCRVKLFSGFEVGLRFIVLRELAVQKSPGYI